MSFVGFGLPGPAEVAMPLAMVFFAGLLRGYTGFGFSIAAVPLLSLIMPPAAAVPVVVMLQFLVSLNGLPEAIRLVDRASIGFMALGAAAGTPLGVLVLRRLDPDLVRLAIATLVGLAVAVLGCGFRFRLTPSGPKLLLIGLASGLSNGVAGMPGPPVIAFYLASPFASHVARASMVVFFLLTAALAVASLAPTGLLTGRVLLPVLLGLPLVLAGSWLGGFLFRRTDGSRFRPVALVVLGTVAAMAAIRAALDLA